MPSKMLPAEQFDPNGVEGWDGPFFQADGNAAELGQAMSENELHCYKDQFGNFDDLYLDVVSPPFQLCDDEIKKITGIDSQNSELDEAKDKGSQVFPFEILRRYGKKQLRSDGEKSNAGSKMSTENIIELAAEKFIQSMSKRKRISRKGNGSYPISSVPWPSEDESKEVQLVQNLLTCAERVGDKKYERGIELLKECKKMSSCTGTAIQRLVFHFAEALKEKIDKETRTASRQVFVDTNSNPIEALKWSNRFLFAFYKMHPLPQVTRFSGIQGVLDNVVKAIKVHVIDLEIKSGVQCTILMQALAARDECPVRYLKITAVGMIRTMPEVEETGRRLTSFAESLNLEFSFKIVMVSDFLALEKDLFHLENDEAVAVYAAYALSKMITRPNRVEHLIRMIKSFSPCVMIVSEMVANCNSPTFVKRFVEALFFHGALFDSLEECMKNDEKIRRDAESTSFNASIRNMVAAEGDERKVRYVNVHVWRAFFARFGLVETKLSMSSLLQADLVRKSFPCGSSCTLGMNGKCLIIGWKGTPLSVVSAWKFQECDESKLESQIQCPF